MATKKAQPPAGEQQEQQQQEGAATKGHAPEARTVLDPALLQRIYDRVTPTGRDAMDPGHVVVPRRRLTLELTGDMCAPGLFYDDDGVTPLRFTVTLEALSAAEELKAVRGCTDPTEVVHRTAKASIVALNGAPVIGTQLDFLWEALAGARQVVLMAYGRVGSVTPNAAGKALDSSTIT